MAKEGYVYLLTNKNNTTLYTGVTRNLKQRIYQHKHHLVEGFTHKYNCDKLVWFEHADEIASAIAREKQIKAGSRKKKEALIQSLNLDWVDLAKDWY